MDNLTKSLMQHLGISQADIDKPLTAAQARKGRRFLEQALGRADRDLKEFENNVRQSLGLNPQKLPESEFIPDDEFDEEEEDDGGPVTLAKAKRAAEIIKEVRSVVSGDKKSSDQMKAFEEVVRAQLKRKPGSPVAGNSTGSRKDSYTTFAVSAKPE